MSFGGFGGFGQSNNNNNQSSGGFGFGTNTNNTSTPGGFGSTNTTSAFGANKSTFGTPASGGGLFGSSNNNSNTTTSGNTFGAFGGNNNTTTTSGFGSSSGNSLFGANKPATTGTGFGSTSTGGGLFGGGTNTTSGFGAVNNPGIGNAGDPPGTNAIPFQAYQEKEGGSSTTTNSFQNILFQDPYKKWSADELRLVDYAQGRRFGNASGGGAFGVNAFGSGTSAFGTTNNTNQAQTSAFGSSISGGGGSLFGTNNNTTTTNSTGFGTNNSNTTSAFGSGGGMFGTKPAATGGLFGGASTTNTTSGGLFGNSNTAGSGTTSNAFGSNTGSAFGQTNTPAAGGGLFGNNTAKPATSAFGSGFGSNNTTGTTTGAFGQSNTTTTGAFGQTNTGTTGGGLFGGSTPATNTGGGLFGNNNTTAPASTNAFGATNTTSTSGGGLFGNNNAAKPGGLFGSAQTTTPATGGTLFGNNTTNNTTTTTNAFGVGNNANSGTTGGSLFGAAKPATSGGLFGNNAPAATTGGSLFGNAGAANNTIQSTGGLFGAAGQTQQKPSLFGQAQTTGTGAFGAQNSQAGGSLFGGAQAGSSLLGQNNLTGNQNVGTGAQGLNASINDVSAYGNASLFAGLSSGEVSNPGPLATPLSTKGKAKKSNVLPMYKLNPASSSRYATPQKRGFGFSYSTYGTPSSPASTSGTPSGLGRSLLATSLSRGLSRSLSTTSLRRTYGGEEGPSGASNGLPTNTILTPGAFSSSTTSRYYGGSGSLNSGNKKLIINRDVRSDLFSTPSKDKPLIECSSNPAPAANGSTRKLSKRVSFETNGGVNSDKEEVSSAPKSRVSALADSERGIKASVSMPSLHDSVKGNELAIVHEEEIDSPVPTTSTIKDSLPGQYWMSPSIKEISSMNRLQRQSVVDFTVGRENVGQVQFKVPVDLSNIDIDDIVDNIVILETRSATVYPIAEKKPPMGRGLNVPARITLEQSWPRGKRDTSDEKRIAKHVNRLRRIVDTEFEDYDPESGVWIFSVEHFTTYGLDDEDESDADATEFPESTEKALAAPQNQADLDGECSILSPSSDSFGSDPDDTFDFRNKRLVLPGTFDSAAATNTQSRVESHLQSFLGASSVGSGPNQIMLSVEDSDLGDEYAASDGEDMASLTTGKHHAAEHFEDYSSASSEALEEDTNNDESEDDDLGDDEEEAPGGGVLRARMRALKMSAGPVRVEVTDGDDWMDMLKKTVSPVKRDRVQFRDGNAELMPIDMAAQPGIVDSEEEERELLGIVGEGRGFATTIDLMNSLFERPSSKPKPQPQPRGFVQWPYDRQPKVADAPTNIPITTRVRWGPDGTMVMATRPAESSLQPMNLNDNSILSIQNRRLPDELSGVRLGRLSADRAAHLLDNHMRHTKVNILNGVPKASLDIPSLKTMFQDRNTSDTGAAHEKLVWDLASILFDPIQDGSCRDRKDKLSAFWTDLVASSCATEAAFSKSPEMKAVASLAGHRVQEACKHLLDGKNFHLATLVSLIGTDETLKNDMRDQLSGWRDAMMLSELSEPVRAIYEMIAGNVCVCEGMKGVPPQDRIESFVISTKFSLDWMQAFGLRLWYATSPNDSLAVSIRKFHNDISQGLEPLPMPWFIKQAIAPLWDDKARDQRQDLLWGLLKLYAGVDTGLECVVCPENSQMSPLDWRLSWQLGQALSSVTDLSFGANSETRADSVTLSFASQLINEGSWLQAVFVLLHIHDPESRAKAIRDQLAQNAGSIGIESDDTFITLTQVFKIPAAWVWESQALYMRSVMHDAPAEVRCLLRAGALVEAHQRFTEEVAPLAIIERDYKLLSSILAQFEDRHDTIPNWSLGGDVYQDFLSIINIKTKKESVPISLLTKMLSTLPAMQEASVNQDALVTAAVSEMSSIIARIITEVSQDSLLHRVLSIPLTEDGHLKYSIDLSIAYYKGIMTR